MGSRVSGVKGQWVYIHTVHFVICLGQWVYIHVHSVQCIDNVNMYVGDWEPISMCTRTCIS